jgi:hypothetical protein
MDCVFAHVGVSLHLKIRIGQGENVGQRLQPRAGNALLTAIPTVETLGERQLLTFTRGVAIRVSNMAYSNTQ